MSLSDTTPRGLLLTGLVFATALTTANAAINIFTTESVGAKVGKAGVAALFIAGTSIAANTILKKDNTVDRKGRYYK